MSSDLVLDTAWVDRSVERSGNWDGGVGVCLTFSRPVRVRHDGAQLQRWYYNAVTRTCDPFTYAGERGTQNMFLTQADCERVGCPSE